MTIRLTTIIPAYNAADTLGEAVRSLVEQRIDGHEILIIDDGSADSTPAVAERLALAHEEVWVIDQRNAGVSAARNAGLGVARGEWVHFLDADDWMLPGGLVLLLEAAERTGLAGACGHSGLFDESGRALGWSTGPGVAEREVGIEHLLGRNRFQPGAMVLRRGAMDGLLFDPRITHAEDWDMWLRLGGRGVRWGVVSEEVAAYRLSRSGASQCFSAMASSMRAVLESAFSRCRAQLASVVPPSALRRENQFAAVRRVAIHQASAASLLDCSGDADESFTVLASNWPTPGVEASAAELAQGAFWMVPFAGGCAPNAWYDADDVTLSRYMRALRALWTRCVREGFITGSAVGAARERLAALCVPPERIADRLARGCVPGRKVTLIGLGHNARHVAAALAATGVRFDARDDRFGPSTSTQVLWGMEVEVAGRGGTLDESALHIVTPSDDARIVASLPPGLDCVRWSHATRELSGEVLARMESAGENRRDMIGAAA